MARFRKKPVVIEAFRWTGGPDQTEDPEWIVAAMQEGIVRLVYGRRGSGDPLIQVELAIDTLEGTMYAEPGDWIIKGIKDELYPCKPDIFEASYEPVD